MQIKGIRLLLTLFVLASCVTIQGVYGQADSLGQPHIFKNAVSFVPQYTINNGFRLDYDRSLKNDNIWLGLGTMFFYVQGRVYGYGFYDNVNSISGFGLLPNIKFMAFRSQKLNFRSGNPRHTIYIEAGPHFQYYSVNHETEVPVEFVEDGVTYFEFERQNTTSAVYRTGLNLNTGWQIALNRFVLDLYLGAGFRVSSAERQTEYYYYYGWDSILYTGFLLNGGVKFGLLF